jgi:hypothetical protein
MTALKRSQYLPDASISSAPGMTVGAAVDVAPAATDRYNNCITHGFDGVENDEAHTLRMLREQLLYTANAFSQQEPPAAQPMPDESCLLSLPCVVILFGILAAATSMFFVVCMAATSRSLGEGAMLAIFLGGVLPFGCACVLAMLMSTSRVDPSRRPSKCRRNTRLTLLIMILYVCSIESVL